MPETVLGNEPVTGGLDVGGRVRTLRQSKGLTLDRLSEISGVSRSALSKIEKSQVSPTVEILAKVARGLDVDLCSLLSLKQEDQPVGRRAVTFQKDAKPTENAHYVLEAHAVDLTKKRMLPFCVTVKARALSDFDDWDRHDSEDFLYVLEGSVVLHFEWYAPLTLKAGDSVYMDSRMGHALTSASEDQAKVLWINAG